MKETGEMPPQRNPVDRPLVTLDTNVILALRNHESMEGPARQILALNDTGLIVVNVTLSTLLENQRPGERMDLPTYVAWLESLGIERANIFTHPRTIGFLLPGKETNTITFDFRLELDLNIRIHQSLFPTIPFHWPAYLVQECEKLKLTEIQRQALAELQRSQDGFYIPPNPYAPARPPAPTWDALDPEQQEYLHNWLKRWQRTWQNAKNDALGLYNHLTTAVHTTNPDQAIFVTNDRNFHKESRRAALRRLRFPGEIMRPPEAVAFLHEVVNTALPLSVPTGLSIKRS
jgi:hypothetical protein